MVDKQRLSGISTRVLIVIASAIATFLILYFSIPLLYPFLIGWLIAMMIEPLICWLERKWKVPRVVGSFLIIFLLLALLLTVIIFIIAGIVIELTNFAQQLPAFFDDLGKMISQTFVKQNTILSQVIDTIQSYLQKNPTQQASVEASIQENIAALAKQGTMLITDIISGIGTFLGNLPYLITVLVFITLATFFISLKWPQIKERLERWIPESIQQTGGAVSKDLKKALFGFIRAQLILITISGIIMYIGLLILQIPYAVSIAIFIAIVDLLPYLGVGAVLVPWVIYLFFVGNFQLAVGLSIVYLIILITRQAMEPKLVASNVGLDPLVTLIALFIGLHLLGFIGFIVGPTVAVVFIALHRANVFRDILRYIKG
jgi:sporulation integral membrane protein YtvI